MEEEKIIIEIDEEGRITADLEGFTGEVCEVEIKALLEGLAEINRIDKKDDYFQEVNVDQRRDQGNVNRLGSSE